MVNVYDYGNAKMGANYLLAASEDVTVSLHEQSCTFVSQIVSEILIYGV